MEETEKHISFNACEYLDFSDNYSAAKVLISMGKTTKVCWDRPVFDESDPRLVQFCKKRGRLNQPEACHCESTKQCNDYVDFKHQVSMDNIQT